MLNRVVPAAAEGLPKRHRNMTIASPGALAAIGYDAETIEFARLVSQMSLEEKRALKAVMVALKDGSDPTEEIIAALGAERSKRFLRMWWEAAAIEAKPGEDAR